MYRKLAKMFIIFLIARPATATQPILRSYWPFAINQVTSKIPIHIDRHANQIPLLKDNPGLVVLYPLHQGGCPEEALKITSRFCCDNLNMDQFRFTHYKDDRVTIFFREMPVTWLKGRSAIRFSARLDHTGTHEQQRIMARQTGNFKRGNERLVNRNQFL